MTIIKKENEKIVYFYLPQKKGKGMIERLIIVFVPLFTAFLGFATIKYGFSLDMLTLWFADVIFIVVLIVEIKRTNDRKN